MSDEYKLITISPAQAVENLAREIYTPYTRDVFMPQWIDINDTEEMSQIVTDLWNYITPMAAEWVSGSRNVNADWDEYCTAINNLGLPRLTEIYQAVYDRDK